MDEMLELAGDFLLDGQERIEHVEEILLSLGRVAPEQREDLLVQAKRELHTLKGNAGMMGLSDVQNLAHSMEDHVESLDADLGEMEVLFSGIDGLRKLMDLIANPDGVAGGSEGATTGGDHLAESIRVPFADLDNLVDVLAEMVIFRNRLGDAVTKGRLCEDHDQAWADVETAEEALGGTLNVLQDRVVGLRMVPLKTLFVSLKRVVHDVEIAEGKEIDFEVVGGDTPMDKALLEVASEALGHLVRNAAVHGIESPGQREAAGKSRRGRIRLVARAEANDVQIDVEDDGRGIDTAELTASARSKGIDVDDLEDPYALLFHPGLSTHGSADMDAGRGMGLAAARDSVQRLGGRIAVGSRTGLGSCFRLHLPLSVSITRALLVRADGETYAIPITHVKESLHFDADDVTEVNHALVHRRRGAVIPLLDLGLVFGTADEARDAGFVVLIEAAGKSRGLLVDGMAGIREIVVKGLDSMVGTPRGVSGSTILGDGRVVLILDPTGLVHVNTSLRQGDFQ